MVNQIRNPPPVFADAVKAHFRLRIDDIEAKIRSWIDKAKAEDLTGTLNRVKQAPKNMEEDLAKLKAEVAKL